jgi:hypothetical protein
MDAKEKLIAEIMAEAEKDGEPVTREEAEEMAEMELKAKGIKRYEVTDKLKEKKKREVKLDDVKVEFIKELVSIFDYQKTANDVQIVNPQREISFRIGEDSYSLTLTKHRQPKEKKGK